MKLKLIANPVAGWGNARTAVPVIEAELKRYGLTADLIWTERPWHAAEIARQVALDGYDLAVAIGGDGTVHEVVNGLAGSETALLIVPVGRGNDFLPNLDAATDIRTICHHLVEGQTRQVDIGRVWVDDQPPRYFVNAIGIGFDAQVALEVRQVPFLSGMPLYMAGLFRTLALSYQTPAATLRFDDEPAVTQTLTLIAIGNGRRYGGGFLICPHARVDDGRFDVCYARGLGRLAILGLLPHVIKGTHLDKEPVSYRQATRVEVLLSQPLAVHAEGENLALKASRVVTEVVQRGLKVRVA